MRGAIASSGRRIHPRSDAERNSDGDGEEVSPGHPEEGRDDVPDQESLRGDLDQRSADRDRPGEQRGRSESDCGRPENEQQQKAGAGDESAPQSGTAFFGLRSNLRISFPAAARARTEDHFRGRAV